jgi:Insertion element 4 transposase N-terminal/Transposase DDE domain
MLSQSRHLPNGNRITDELAMGILAKRYPTVKVREILQRVGKASQRERELPAHLMVYYVMGLGLWMGASCREVLRCLLSGVHWLLGSEKGYKVAGKSGITQARQRLGWEAMKAIHDELVQPIGEKHTRGAWYRGWRVVSLDGSTMDVADSQDNEKAFGRARAWRGQSAYPQLRFVALLENGTHVLFGAQLGSYACSELSLAEQVIPQLQPGMLCLADRLFTGGPLWKRAAATGADLLWRGKRSMKFACVQRLQDGSYLSYLYPNRRERLKHPEDPSRRTAVRIIEYRFRGKRSPEPWYRLVTTLLDPQQAPARELAALYHERWEIENTLDEFKVHLRGPQVVLRSQTPDLVRQEFYGFLLLHFAVRTFMHEAAISANRDPDELSFVHAVRVLKRHLPLFVISPCRGTRRISSRHLAGNPSGKGQTLSRAAYAARGETKNEPLSHPQ